MKDPLNLRSYLRVTMTKTHTTHPLQKADETLDRLNQKRWIFQRKKGHKATTDDQLLAWAAWLGFQYHQESPTRIFDLGSGKGTVSLLLTSLDSSIECIGIEAFAQSYEQSIRNRTLNQISTYTPYLGDLRDSTLSQAIQKTHGHPHILCGAPPFMPLGSGVLPQDQQRAHGRFEINGGVEAYLERYAFLIASYPQCIGFLLMDGLSYKRTCQAIQVYPDLNLTQCTSIYPRPHQPPTYQIFTLTHPTHSLSPLLPSSLTLRPTDSLEWTESYQKIRSILLLNPPHSL